MDESWKVIFEALAFQPDHPNWELVVQFLAKRPKDQRNGADYYANTPKEMRAYMAWAREEYAN